MSKLNPCTRMTVRATGYKSGEIVTAINGNQGKCTGEAGKCGCTHAEMRLLERMPHPVLVYITHSPCINCAKALVKAGVKEVLYEKEYRLKEGIEYLKENGIKVTRTF